MPPQKDARRLNPDPANEPNLYSISEQFPVPEQTSRTVQERPPPSLAARASALLPSQVPLPMEQPPLTLGSNTLLPQPSLMLSTLDSLGGRATGMAGVGTRLLNNIDYLRRGSDQSLASMHQPYALNPTPIPSPGAGTNSLFQSTSKGGAGLLSSMDTAAIWRELEVRQLQKLQLQQQQQLLHQQQQQQLTAAIETDSLRMQLALERNHRRQQEDAANEVMLANLLQGSPPNNAAAWTSATRQHPFGAGHPYMG